MPAVLLLLAGLIAYDLACERRRITAEYEGETARLSDIVAEHTRRLVGDADVVANG